MLRYWIRQVKANEQDNKRRIVRFQLRPAFPPAVLCLNFKVPRPSFNLVVVLMRGVEVNIQASDKLALPPQNYIGYHVTSNNWVR
jgi:hypothetical protein